MSQWKNTDAAGNSVLWATTSVNLPPNTANRDALYNNTTPNSFVAGQTVGQFGVDTTEIAVVNGSVVAYTITFSGSGYTANAVVTVSGDATSNATSNSSGRISAVNVNTAGSGYTTKPTVSVAAPAARSFNANTAVDEAEDFIALSTNVLQNGDVVTYTVASGNTVLDNLTSGQSYFVVGANSSGVKLSNSRGGAAIDLTKGETETGHSLRGQTATAEAVISYAGRGVAHAGWVLRRVGTGGRAGRIQYETLVAMGSMSSDGEDTVFKDS